MKNEEKKNFEVRKKKVETILWLCFIVYLLIDYHILLFISNSLFYYVNKDFFEILLFN